MRTHLLHKMLAAFVLSGFTAAVSHAAILTTDSFNYPDGNLVGATGSTWTTISGTANDVQVVDGQAVVAHGAGSRRDVSLPFIIQASGIVYYSFLMSVDAPAVTPITGTDTEYFVTFRSSTGTFTARVDVIPPTQGGNFTLGLATDAGAPDVTWTASDLTFATDYRVVVSYDATNDVSKLWVDPVNSSSTSITGVDNTSPTNVVSVTLRQDTSSFNETIRVDDVIVATTFEEALGQAAQVSEVAIAATNASQSEGSAGSTNFTFTLTRTGPAVAFDVSYTVSSTAAAGSDFTGGVLPSGTVSFLSTDTTKVLTIPVAGDTAAELDEAFTVTLSNATNSVSIIGATANGSILNDDGTILSIAADTAQLAEGDTGIKAFTFTVTRSGPGLASETAGATYTVTSGTMDSTDFAGGVLPSGLVSFSANDGSETITINIASDTTVELSESFTVTLSSPTGNSTLSTASASSVVVSDDFTFSINEVRISYTAADPADANSTFVEILGAPATATTGLTLVALSGEFAPGVIDFAISLDSGITDSTGVLLVANANSTFTAAGDVPVAGLDFFGSPATFLLVSGFSGTVASDLDTDNDGVLDSTPWTSVLDAVSLIDADATTDRSYSAFAVGPQTDSTFNSPAGIARNASGLFDQLAFLDNTADTPGSLNAGNVANIAISAASASANEGTALTFTVTRTDVLGTAFTVNYAVSSSSADASDFAGNVLPSGSVEFIAGQLTRTITINVASDSTFESDETFTVTLTSATGGTVILTATANGTILNDDSNLPQVPEPAAAPALFGLLALMVARRSRR